MRSPGSTSSATRRSASGRRPSTAQFLKAQLTDMKAKLDEQERRIGQAPLPLEAEVAGLERLNMRLRVNSDRQLRAMDRRERLVKEAEGPALAATPGAAPETPAARLAKLKQELAELKTRYTDKYPDVIRIKGEIAALEARAETSRPEPAAAAAPRAGKDALAEVDAELRMLKDEERTVQQQIAGFEHRTDAAPKRQQEFQRQARDYATTKEFYQSLLKRYEDAQIAESMEQGQKSEQFRILDAAVPSKEPLAPNRMRLGLLALALSLGAAALVAMLRERLDTSFHTVDDLRAFSRVPVIAGIPPLVTERDLRQRRWRLGLVTVVARGGDRNGRRRLVPLRPQQRAAHAAPVGRIGARHVPRLLRPPRAAVQRDARPAVPVPHAGPPRGARAAHLRRAGGQGLHRPHRRGGHGQDHAAPRVHERIGRAARMSRSSSTPRCRSTASSSTCSRTSASRAPGKSRAQRLVALNRFLIERRRAGQTTAAVIVDEAQNLSLANLEHLRLLSNFETPTEKLLQIILVGQPELRDKLARPELRQLRQRLGMRCADPAAHPRRDARATSGAVSASPALPTRGCSPTPPSTRIAAYTNGIPRLVNILCDHCLLIGYTEQTRRVEREMVERGIEYLEDGQRPAHARGMFWRPARRRLRWLVGGLGAAAIAGVSLLAAAAGGLIAPGPIAGQFLDYARLARDLVMR